MRRFVYLFQVEQDLPEHLAEAEGPDSEVRFLSYRARSADRRALYYPSSSWTQGRNRLLREVVDGDWLYYVFGDADVHLEIIGRNAERQNPWRAFEEFLLAHEPAVGTPAYAWHLSGQWDLTQETRTLRFFDPVLNAFHREALRTLLPYYDLLDEECADYSGSIVCSLAADLYAGHVLQSNRVRVLNPISQRAYTERLMTKPETLYLDAVPDPKDRASYRRQPEWSQLPHPDMGAPCRKTASYRRTTEELALRYRLDHPLWVRKCELLAMPLAHEFYGEGPASARAQRWRAHGAAAVPVRAMGGLRKLWLRTHALRVRLGLVRTSGLFLLVYRIRNVRHSLRTRLQRWRRRLRRPNEHALWNAWRTAGRALAELPAGGPDAIDLIGHALDQLDDPEVIFVDVGTGRGEALGRIQDGVSQRKRVISIGVDPVQTRGFTWYTGFVLGTVTDGEMTLAAILRQYGLVGRVLHWVRINHDDPVTVCRTLGQQLQRCLFLTVRCAEGAAGSAAAAGASWPEVRDTLATDGFRVVAVIGGDSTQHVEATLINASLAQTLLPTIAS
ncbi:MAG: hypothetical protein WC700_03765 [Gemmatimonadaceae bacterium]|jgi:hypothetical protein